MKRAMAMLAITVLATAGCKREPEKARGDAPPPVASAVAGLCDSGGGKVADAIAAKLLPRTIEGYCLEPHNEVRTYGKDAKGTIEQVCTELFDGECEVYRGYGLERVVSARYADGKGTPGTVTINLSRFESAASAFGFFTKRVLGDADPATLTMEPFEAGTLAVLGSGVAYVWRGPHVAELSYANDNEAPEALKASSKRILPQLSKSLGDLLPGDRELPPAARLLPNEGRVKLGLVYEPKDLLGVTGAGPGAIGFYRDGDRRYRILSLERANDQAAQDVMKTFKRVEGAADQKGPPPTLILSQRASDGTKTEWVFGRVGRVVVGVGDDEHGSQEGPGKAGRLPLSEKAAKLSAALSASAKLVSTTNAPQ